MRQIQLPQFYTGKNSAFPVKYFTPKRRLLDPSHTTWFPLPVLPMRGRRVALNSK
jgi:hypothetical protein